MACVGGDLEAAAELYGRQHSYVITIFTFGEGTSLQ